MSTNLYFENSGKCHPIPKWAEYFIRVGKELALADFDPESRIITAIAAPTRAYCAAFIGLGMVMSDATKKEHHSEAVHFKNLLDLPIGTPVIYSERPGRTLKGITKQPKELYEKLCIGVQVSSKDGGELTCWVDEARALQVQLAKHSGKLPKKQGITSKRFFNEFVNSILGDSDQVQLGVKSKIVCAIVGKKNLLEHEVRKTTFAVLVDDNRLEKGCLQDVLRVDRLAGEQSHRTALIPVVVGQSYYDIFSRVEIGVVFDGASGFLKWGTKWNNRHQVVILDRTEPYFDDAINDINYRFSQNRSNTKLSLPYGELTLPPGVEMLSFREMVE